MAFEAFLNETHRRPPRTTRIGFAASVALHGPPLGWFVASWLTHAILIGSSAMYPETVLNHGTYYVPISFYGQGPGGGNPTAAEAAPGGTHPRSGLLGRSGRAGRRGLIAPREVKRLPSKTANAWRWPAGANAGVLPSRYGMRSSVGVTVSFSNAHAMSSLVLK